jgi:hypothetical protein
MQQLVVKRVSWLTLVGSIAVSALFVVGATVFAEHEGPVTFPIADLGNCESKSACREYCDDPANVEVCVNFAEGHKLISSSEAAQGRKFARLAEGPGGCKSPIECRKYCEDATHIDECVAFAEQHGLMEKRELDEARNIRQALLRGAKLPGDCKNKTACEAYCKAEQHAEECVAFAEVAGFIDKNEADLVRKTGGRGPGDCRGKEQCEVYCHEEANFAECLAFAEQHNLISPDEAERARKTGGKGPGGCRGRECESYCKTEEHAEECFRFAQANGLLKEDAIRRMDEGKAHLKRALTEAPPEVVSCLKSTVGEEVLAKLESGAFFGGQELGEKMRACFEQVMGQQGRENMQDRRPGVVPAARMPLDGDKTGPGGCATPEECRTYCAEHPDECRQLQPVGNREELNSGPFNREKEVRPFQGPGGCTSPEECRKLCDANPELCRGFTPPVREGGVPAGAPKPTCNSPEECEALRARMMQNKETNQQRPNGQFPTPADGQRPFVPQPGMRKPPGDGVNARPYPPSEGSTQPPIGTGEFANPPAGTTQPDMDSAPPATGTTVPEPVSGLSPTRLVAAVVGFLRTLFE